MCRRSLFMFRISNNILPFNPRQIKTRRPLPSLQQPNQIRKSLPRRIQHRPEVGTQQIRNSSVSPPSSHRWRSAAPGRTDPYPYAIAFHHLKHTGGQGHRHHDRETFRNSRHRKRDCENKALVSSCFRQPKSNTPLIMNLSSNPDTAPMLQSGK